MLHGWRLKEIVRLLDNNSNRTTTDYSGRLPSTGNDLNWLQDGEWGAVLKGVAGSCRVKYEKFGEILRKA